RPYRRAPVCVSVKRDFAEAEGVKHCDGASTHGEDIAKNTANARRGALEGFDVARVVMGFDFERGDEAVTDVDYAGVFAGALHHESAACGETLEMDFARFVGGVFAPHHREDAELGDVGIAPKDLPDARVFLGGHAVLSGDFGGDRDFGGGGGHGFVHEL